MNPDLITNMQEDRAFDRKTGKLLVVILATGALALACVSESDGAAPGAKAPAGHPAASHALPAHSAAVPTTIFGHPRSIWAIRWEQQHPAEAAAYRRSHQARPAVRAHRR